MVRIKLRLQHSALRKFINYMKQEHASSHQVNNSSETRNTGQIKKLFDCYRFGKVPGLVDIAAAQYGKMV